MPSRVAMVLSEAWTSLAFLSLSSWGSRDSLKPQDGFKELSRRPYHPIVPYHTSHPFPDSPARQKTCVVKSHGYGKDDSDSILSAVKDCNDGGHVVFKFGEKFIIGTALDLTFLKHIDLGEERFSI